MKMPPSHWMIKVHSYESRLNMNVDIPNVGHTDLDGLQSSGSSSSHDSPTPVGPIVGGVVGGVALIAAIALAWWFFRRRRLNKEDTDTNNDGGPLGDGNDCQHSYFTRRTTSMIQSPLSPLSGRLSYFGSLHDTLNPMSTNTGHTTDTLTRNSTQPSTSSSGIHYRPIEPQDVIFPFRSTSGTPTSPRGKAGLVYSTSPRRAQTETDESATSNADTSLTRTRRMNPPAYTPSSNSFEQGHRRMDSDLASGEMSQSEGTPPPGDFADGMVRKEKTTNRVNRPVEPSGDVDPAQ